MAKDKILVTALTSEQLKKELERSKKKPKAGKFFIWLIFSIVIITAIISILTTLFFPIMSIHGGSMLPTLEEGNLVVAIKTNELERGDVCAFYSGDSVLCKRVIAFGGETVDIDENGIVFIDGVPLSEPQISAASLGNADIEFPYSVPDNTYFVMGDNRATSIDSRNEAIGCIQKDQMIGRLVFRFWPFDKLGAVE